MDEAARVLGTSPDTITAWLATLLRQKVIGPSQWSKWTNDAQALARRLHDGPYAEAAAVIDIVERLWADPQADWPALLRTWGVLPDDSAPRTGESTEPLREDQVATLVELVRAERREDYDALCAALGVVNGPALWAGIQRRV